MVAMITRIIALLLCVMTVSGSQTATGQEHELVGQYIERLGMTIYLPAESYFTDRTVEDSYKPLELLGMSASQLEVELKKGNVYGTALWFPEENDMTEILVTMTEDDDSRAIFQLRDYDDFYLGSLAESYADYSEHGVNVSAMYSDASVVKTGQAAFIKAHGVILSPQAAENHLHYMTVVNGQRIEITLVEHYTNDENTQRPLYVSEGNERMMEEIIETLVFDDIDNEFVAKNKNFVAGAVVISVLSLAMIVAYIVSRIRVSRALASAAQESMPHNEDESAAVPGDSEASEDKAAQAEKDALDSTRQD